MIRRGAVLAAALLVVTLPLAACSDQAARSFQGYAEGELVFVGPEEVGRVVALDVEEGDRVKPGAPLFAVDEDVQKPAVDEAAASLAQAEANLANLKAATQRPEEIAVLEASERRAEAALSLSRLELDRQRELTTRKVGSQAALDTAQSTHDQNQAALDEIRRQISVAHMPARADQIAAATQAVDAAKASLASAKVRLDRRRRSAPVEGSVEEVYFRPGELVPAGRPVVALLPPDRIRMRFFVDEPNLPRFRIGTRVNVTCDGCGKPVPARVSYIAASAEYTPPVIYSLDERAKLVFLLEARPDDPLALRPGQPITVEPVPDGGAP